MREHKCFLCDTIYYSNEAGYYGYCSDACRNVVSGKDDHDATQDDGRARRSATAAHGKEVR